jgi:hypothetical protein
MNFKGRSRWFALGVAGVAILAAVLWIISPWTSPAGHSPAPAGASASVRHESQEITGAGAESSEMFKMTRAAFQACGAPEPPTDVPDGATATREQMVAAHDTVKAFDEATTIYTQCVDTTAYQAGVQFKSVATRADTEALAALQTQLHNAAIDRDQALANRFNVQLRLYKARAQK